MSVQDLGKGCILPSLTSYLVGVFHGQELVLLTLPKKTAKKIKNIFVSLPGSQVINMKTLKDF